MTLHRWGKLEETARGVGQVRRKGTVVASASYDLKIETENITARSFVTDEGSFVRKTATGDISLLDGIVLPGDEHGNPADSFILVLDDGREVDFRVESCVLHQDPKRQECRIRGSAGRR
jgi:hypothetical protein